MNRLPHPHLPLDAAGLSDAQGAASAPATCVMLPAEAFGPLADELSATIDALTALEIGLGDLAQDLASTAQVALDLAIWIGKDDSRIQQANALKPEIALIAVVGVAIRGQTALIQATTAEITDLAAEIHTSFGRARTVDDSTVVVSLDRYRRVAPQNRQGEERAAELLETLGRLMHLTEVQLALQGKVATQLADTRTRLDRIRKSAEPETR